VDTVEIVRTAGVAVLALCLFSTGWAIRLFNRLIYLRTLKEEGWSGVLAALKRRRDLIPNILKLAEVYIMAHESEALLNTIQAHAQGQVTYSVAEVKRAEEFTAVTLARIMAIMENHPNLKAEKSIMQIHEELSGLEERIEKTRHYYNATVRDYNMEMDQFPANLVVGLMGFKRAALFESDEQ